MNKERDLKEELERIENGIFESEDIKWIDYEPDNEDVLYEWLGEILPRHMPVYDWNRPWVVAISLGIKQMLKDYISKQEVEEVTDLIGKHIIDNYEKCKKCRKGVIVVWVDGRLQHNKCSNYFCDYHNKGYLPF